MASIVSLIFYGGDLALITDTKKQIEPEKMLPKMGGKFFIIPSGIYESDIDYEYKLNKQPITFFNSHDLKIPKKSVKLIKKNYFKKRYTKVLEELERIYPFIKDIPRELIDRDEILKTFHAIVEKTEHHAIDLTTEKYLFGHIAYNPKALRMTKLITWAGRKAVETLFPRLKVTLPWILVMAGLIALAIVSQHLSEWIGGVVTWVQNSMNNIHF